MKMSVIGRRGSSVLSQLTSRPSGAPSRSFTTSVSEQPWHAQAPAQTAAPPRAADNDLLHLAMAILGLTVSAYCSKHFMSQPSVRSFQAAPAVTWTEPAEHEVKPVETSP